ncbi:MAG: hypothetical protein R3F62_20155 [Planctomycetota bacterium]
MQLPLRRLNLRRNPFGELPLEGPPRAGGARPGAAPGLAPARGAAGPGGQGPRQDRTHLLALRAAADFHLHLPEDAPLPPVPDRPAPALPGPETQRLPQRLRRRLFAGPGRLVLGAHEDHARELERAGRPTVSVRAGGAWTARGWPRSWPAGSRPRVAARGRALEQREPQAPAQRFGDDVRGIERALPRVPGTGRGRSPRGVSRAARGPRRARGRRAWVPLPAALRSRTGAAKSRREQNRRAREGSV